MPTLELEQQSVTEETVDSAIEVKNKNLFEDIAAVMGAVANAKRLEMLCMFNDAFDDEGSIPFGTTELCEMFKTSRGAMTNHLIRLTGVGLLERTADSEDIRHAITPVGKTLLKRMQIEKAQV